MLYSCGPVFPRRVACHRAPDTGASATPADDDIAGLSFEQALTALEDIVRSLEGGRVDLDRAVGAYERGVLLKRHCEAKLAEAKAKVERITIGPDGTAQVSPLDPAGAS